MSDPFLAEIIMFGGNFNPRGWALCDGQLLAINSYQALFSLLGTTFGGDGRTTFGLPGLRGRVAVHPGNGPGLSPVTLGQKGGSNTNILNANQLPSHNHPLAPNAVEEDANQTEPNGNALAVTGAAGNIYYNGNTAPDKTTKPSATLNAGNSQPVNNMQPFIGINYIIALQGTFPSRN